MNINKKKVKFYMKTEHVWSVFNISWLTNLVFLFFFFCSWIGGGLPVCGTAILGGGGYRLKSLGSPGAALATGQLFAETKFKKTDGKLRDCVVSAHLNLCTRPKGTVELKKFKMQHELNCKANVCTSAPAFNVFKWACMHSFGKI